MATEGDTLGYLVPKRRLEASSRWRALDDRMCVPRGAAMLKGSKKPSARQVFAGCATGIYTAASMTTWRTPMALNIRNAETERLAERVVTLTGETKTAAVTQALRERLERLERVSTGRQLADELDEIALHSAGLPVLDPRSANEILGYDAHGLPD